MLLGRPSNPHQVSPRGTWKSHPKLISFAFALLSACRQSTLKPLSKKWNILKAWIPNPTSNCRSLCTPVTLSVQQVCHPCPEEVGNIRVYVDCKYGSVQALHWNTAARQVLDTLLMLNALSCSLTSTSTIAQDPQHSPVGCFSCSSSPLSDSLSTITDVFHLLQPVSTT